MLSFLTLCHAPESPIGSPCFCYYITTSDAIYGVISLQKGILTCQCLLSDSAGHQGVVGMIAECDIAEGLMEHTITLTFQDDYIQEKLHKLKSYVG